MVLSCVLLSSAPASKDMALAQASGRRISSPRQRLVFVAQIQKGASAALMIFPGYAHVLFRPPRVRSSQHEKSTPCDCSIEIISLSLSLFVPLAALLLALRVSSRLVSSRLVSRFCPPVHAVSCCNDSIRDTSYVSLTQVTAKSTRERVGIQARNSPGQIERLRY